MTLNEYIEELEKIRSQEQSGDMEVTQFRYDGAVEIARIPRISNLALLTARMKLNRYWYESSELKKGAKVVAL